MKGERKKVKGVRIRENLELIKAEDGRLKTEDGEQKIRRSEDEKGRDRRAKSELRIREFRN